MLVIADVADVLVVGGGDNSDAVQVVSVGAWSASLATCL